MNEKQSAFVEGCEVMFLGVPFGILVYFISLMLLFDGYHPAQLLAPLLVMALIGAISTRAAVGAVLTVAAICLLFASGVFVVLSSAAGSVLGVYVRRLLGSKRRGP